MTKPIRKLLLAATLAAVGATSGYAHGDGSGESSAGAQASLVSRLTDEGLAFYSAHEYRRAVEKFMAAYAMDPDPNLLFNTARCYEQLGDGRAAIDKYESFLAEPGGDPNGRRKAEQALASLRKTKSSGPAPGTTPREATSPE